MLTLLAHGGAGASWQALLTVIGVLAAVLFVLVVLRVVKVQDHNDLVLPLAGIVILSSLSTTASSTLSDQVGWALPLGVVALVGLVWFAFDAGRFTLTSPFTIGVVVAAAVATLGLHAPLTKALHPAPALLDTSDWADADDAVVTIVSPTDEAEVSSPLTLQVELTGATYGGLVLGDGDAPEDPEELGNLRVSDFPQGQAGSILSLTPLEDCSPDAPCTSLTYQLELTPGRHQLVVEFLTARGRPFRTSVYARVVVDVA